MDASRASRFAWSEDDITPKNKDAKKSLSVLIEEARALLKYDPDQARQSNGEFGSGTTDATTNGVEFPRNFAIKTAPVGAQPDYNSPLAKDEREASNYYKSDSGSRAMNEGLRSSLFPIDAPSNTPLTEAERPSITRQVPEGFASRTDLGTHDACKLLDSYIARNELTRDTVMFRGIVTNREFTVGMRFTDKGYVSCARDLVDARTFARGRAGLPTNLKPMQTYEGTPRVFEILVPKGTRVGAGAKDVGETLLPRGTTFEVVGIKKDAKGAKDMGGVIQLKVVK